MKNVCPKCQGNKKYRGMGSMIIKCEKCKGTGIVEKKPALIAKKSASDKSKKS